jgi:hypothetical protein
VPLLGASVLGSGHTSLAKDDLTVRMLLDLQIVILLTLFSNVIIFCVIIYPQGQCNPKINDDFFYGDIPVIYSVIKLRNGLIYAPSFNILGSDLIATLNDQRSTLVIT